MSAPPPPTALARVPIVGAAGDTLHVVFKVGVAEYALAASRVVQMESFTGATPVPGSPPWVIGLMQVRGRVIPVIDLRERFGAHAGTTDDDARVVIVASDERVVGLRVDRAREVLVLPAASIQPVPVALAHTTAGFVDAIAQVGDRLLLIIDVDRILSEDPTDGD